MYLYDHASVSMPKHSSSGTPRKSLAMSVLPSPLLFPPSPSISMRPQFRTNSQPTGTSCNLGNIVCRPRAACTHGRLTLARADQDNLGLALRRHRREKIQMTARTVGIWPTLLRLPRAHRCCDAAAKFGTMFDRRGRRTCGRNIAFVILGQADC